MQRNSRLQKPRPLRHRSIFMSETCRLWRRNSSRLSYHPVLRTSRRSEPRKYLGEYWFRSIKPWLMIRRMREPKGLRSSQSWRCPYQSFHREWRLMRRRWRKKQRKRELQPKTSNSHLDHRCQRKCRTLRDCTRNLLQSLKETRVRRDWLFPKLSISTSPNRIPHWESTWIKRIRLLIQLWGREEPDPQSSIEIFWRAQWTTHPPPKSTRLWLKRGGKHRARKSRSRIINSRRIMSGVSKLYDWLVESSNRPFLLIILMSLSKRGRIVFRGLRTRLCIWREYTSNRELSWNSM